MAHAKFVVYCTQTAYFTDVEVMNKWLKDKRITPVDIKMTGTNSMTHFLVIYKEEIN